MQRLIPLEPVCELDIDIAGEKAGGGPCGIGVFPPGCGGFIGGEPGLPNGGGGFIGNDPGPSNDGGKN